MEGNKRHNENDSPPQLRRYTDSYDDLGRNISNQERRQEAVKWTKVIYRKNKDKSKN